MSEERSEEVQKSSLLPNANFYPSKDLDLNLRKAVDSEVVPIGLMRLKLRNLKLIFQRP